MYNATRNTYITHDCLIGRQWRWHAAIGQREESDKLNTNFTRFRINSGLGLMHNHTFDDFLTITTLVLNHNPPQHIFVNVLVAL